MRPLAFRCFAAAPFVARRYLPYGTVAMHRSTSLGPATTLFYQVRECAEGRPPVSRDSAASAKPDEKPPKIAPEIIGSPNDNEAAQQLSTVPPTTTHVNAKPGENANINNAVEAIMTFVKEAFASPELQAALVTERKIEEKIIAILDKNWLHLDQSTLSLVVHTLEYDLMVLLDGCPPPDEKSTRRKVWMYISKAVDSVDAPMERIYSDRDLQDLVGYPVFIAGGDSGSFSARTKLLKEGTDPIRFVKTGLTMQLIQDLEEKDKVLLVTGAAGGGKTVAVVGLGTPKIELQRNVRGGKSGRIVVYGTPMRSDLSVHLAKVELAADKGERDKAMVAFLKSFVISTVGPTALSNIKKLKGTSHRLTLVLVLDEMGSLPNCVRAMCSVGRDNNLLKELFEGAEDTDGAKDKNVRTVEKEAGAASNTQSEVANVDIRVVGCGTGIGSFGAENGPGSHPDGWVLRYAAPDTNFISIFLRYVSVNDAAVRKLLHDAKRPTTKPEKTQEFDEPTLASAVKESSPLVFEAITSNARMAALLGIQVGKALGGLSNEDIVRMFTTFNLERLCLWFSIFRFKALNGLEHVPLEKMPDLTVQAVRAHFFWLTPEDSDLETKYGLLVDRAQWRVVKKDGKAGGVSLKTLTISEGNVSTTIELIVEGAARYELQQFSVVLLAMLYNVEIITKSVTSGDSFELYWLTVSYLLGCAAASASRFKRLLERERFEPFNDSASKEPLPTLLLSHIGDVTTDRSDSTGGFQGEASAPEDSKSQPRNQAARRKKDFSRAFRVACEAVKGVKEDMINGNVCRVVALRGPPHFTFADTVLIIDNVMFLWQTKDHGEYDNLKVAEERWKMGATDEEAMGEAGEKDAAYPLSIIDAMVEDWKRITGVDITEVRQGIVTPTKWNKTVGNRSYDDKIKAGGVSSEVLKMFQKKKIYAKENLKKVSEKCRSFNHNLPLIKVSTEHIEFLRFRRDPPKKNILANYASPSSK